MADTFISYSRKDIAFAKIVHDSLQNSKIETWIDWQDIPPAADWFDEIKEAIEQSDTFVFIISPTSINSEVCSKEIAHAQLNNKRLIPIVIGDIDPQEVPSTLLPLNWIFFKQEDQQYAKALNDLVTALTLDQPWIKAHTRIQNRALEWERSEQKSGYLLHGADLEDAENWLAQAADKDPAPTTLQTQYILASRTQATRRQRNTLFGVAAGLVVAVVLGILAWNQRNIAVSEGQMRATAQVEAENAEATAVEEAYTRATQQAIAEEQRIIAESKGLAALSMSKQNQTQFDVALLLAIEGLKKQVNNETKNTMLHALTYNSKLARYLKVDETTDIFTVAANSDFTQIAVAGEGGRMHVLNPVTGLLEYPPIDLGDLEIYDIIFSPDDSVIVVSGSFDGKVFLFDAATGQPLDYSLSFSQYSLDYLSFVDDTTLVGKGSSGNSNSIIYFWNYISGELIDQIEMEIGGFLRMEVSHDQTLMAVGGTALQIMDLQTKEIIVDQDLGRNANSMSFSPDDKLLALGDYSGRVRLWDVAAQEMSSIALYHDDQEDVDHVMFTGTSVLISADENYIYFWNYKTGERLSKWSYDGNFYTKNNMIVSPDDQMLIVGESSGSVSLYSIWETPAGRIPFESDGSFIDNLVYALSGEIVYTVLSQSFESDNYFDEDLIVSWDISTGDMIEDRISTGYEEITLMEISADGNILAYKGRDGQIYGMDKNIWFFDLPKGEMLDQPFHFDDYRDISDFYFFPTGDYLAVISANYDLLVYDFVNDVVVAGPVNLGEFEHDFPEIIVGRDGTWLFVSEGDNMIRMYDTETLSPNGISFSGHRDVIGSMDISLDGSYLVSEGWDNQLILWDVGTGKIISKISNLSRFDYGISNVRFSPDGSMVAVVYDDVLQLLDVPSLDSIGPALYGNIRHLNVTFDDADPILSYGGYFEPVSSFVFSPDGTQLLVGGDDNMRLITLSVDDWIERACFRAGRNLTPEEWATYLPFDDYQKTCSQYP